MNTQNLSSVFIPFSLERINGQKLGFTGLLNTYHIIGKLPRDLSSMRCTLLIRHLDTSQRARLHFDLFSQEALSQVAAEVAAGLGQDRQALEAELLALADALDAFRDLQVPDWKNKQGLCFPAVAAVFTPYLESFRQLMAGIGYKHSKYYLSYCREFLFFIQRQNMYELGKVMPQHIMLYREYLLERDNFRQGAGLSEAYVKKHLQVLSLFFEHLFREGVIPHSPVVLPRQKAMGRVERSILTCSEIEDLYRVATSFDKALLGLCYGCGLRKTEALHLELNEINWEQGTLLVRAGKFHKSRTVPVADRILKDLDTYIHGDRKRIMIHRRSLCPKLLLNQRGKAFCQTSLTERFTQLLRRCPSPYLPFKQVSLQTLRRSISVHLLDKGADLEFVRAFLGHVLLDTTHLYSRKRRLREHFLEEAFNYGTPEKRFQNKNPNSTRQTA